MPLMGVGKWDWARAEVGKPVRMLFEPFRLFLVLKFLHWLPMPSK